MNRLVSVLLWSVISAAFIGPGTVTAAASAGAGFGYALLWALAFSTVACLVLQEASARLTIVSGRTLGAALRARYPRGVTGTAALLLVLGAIVLGCAAYEAGNILGGVAGATLALPLAPRMLTVLMVGIAAVLLWFNSPRRVALCLSLLVAVMGVGFLCTAVRLAPAVTDLARGALIPSLPPDSALLAVALVGTTVVPYNLFLGSGLAVGQRLADVRFGLAVAIVLGGVISMAVLVVGTAVEPPLEFSGLAAVLADRLGGWARYLFAAGLFAAGLSSAVTAPLAAALTARSVFATGADRGHRVERSSTSGSPSGQETAGSRASEPGRWHDRSWRFRGVWAGVLGVGLAFGLSGVRPVPVIVAAQALNGILLPVVALFLLVVANDRRLLGGAVNGLLSNSGMTAATLVTIFLGVSNLWQAASRALGRAAPSPQMVLAVGAIVALATALPVIRAIRTAAAGPRDGSSVGGSVRG